MRATATTAALIAILLCQFGFASSITIIPTTTLTAEISNNTSAATTFRAQSNGNSAPTNVSKVNIHTLLYPGATTKIYTHFMGWFGPSNHMSVGYSSADPAQIKRQIDDLVSRGIDGAIIDWYGPNHYPDDTAAKLMMNYAQSLPGTPFKFAIMEDVGALGSCPNTPGCDLNKTLAAQLTYVINTYACSPAYITLDGRPAIFFFGLEKYTINWDWVKANVPGNPAFVFENAGGFTHPATAGGFSWVQINLGDPNDWQRWYLDDFYRTGLAYPAQHTVGAAYLGFNDSLASWGSNRVMNQNCGQTWLNAWNEIAKYYNSGRQLESVQITTWNDYEEGTEIETGIENCVAISASMMGDKLQWAITGNENNIDHYTVFVSLDGENLMPVVNVSAGARTLDASELGLAPGNYTFYVKAVGRPSMTNKMSNAVAYSVPDPGPVVSLSVTPVSGFAPLVVTASSAGSTSVGGDIIASTIDFGDGTKAGGTTISHTYAVPGTYTLTATVTDAMGVSTSKTTSVTVQMVTGKVTIATPTAGSGVSSPVRISASATANTGSFITAMRVYVDNNDAYTVGASAIDTALSMAPGIHNLVVQAWDNTSAVYQSPLTIAVLNRPPVVALRVTPTSTSTGTTVSASMAGTSDPDGNVASYSINFGDGTIVKASTASHAYTTAGTYAITATATDNLGATSSAMKTVTISAPAPAGGVIVVSPANGATLVNAIHFLASATAQNPITAMRIYVDNVDLYTTPAATVNTYLSLPAGPHSIVVQAWDSTGAVYQKPVSITVQSYSGRGFVN